MEEEGTEVADENEILDDDELDPRIQIELEKLNKAADNINRLDIELEEARYAFRQSLKESTNKLEELAKKLGNCIDRSRPYYEARLRAKEAQTESQEAAFHYEKACSAQAAAKEMVCLAEEAYMDRGEEFDTAWQEMLNHATMKENEAEKEMKECEIIHKLKMELYDEAERQVKELHREFKRAIHKSRPYFEMKAEVNHQLEERKNAVAIVESDVTVAKEIYKEALLNLEKISNEIHLKRGTSCRKETSGGKRSGDQEEPVDGGDVCDTTSPTREESKQMHVSPEKEVEKIPETSETPQQSTKSETEKTQSDQAVFKRGQKQRLSYLYAMRNSMADYDIGHVPKAKIDRKQRSISLFGLFSRRVSPPKDDAKERSSVPRDLPVRVSPPNENPNIKSSDQSSLAFHPSSSQTNQSSALSHSKTLSAKNNKSAISQTESNQTENVIPSSGTNKRISTLSCEEMSSDSEKVHNILPDLSSTGFKEDDTEFQQLPKRMPSDISSSQRPTVLVQSQNGNPPVHVEASTPVQCYTDLTGAPETMASKNGGADSASDAQTSQSDSGVMVDSETCHSSEGADQDTVANRTKGVVNDNKGYEVASYLSVPNSSQPNHQGLDQWSDTESVGSVCSYTLDDDAIEKCMLNTSQIELEFEDIMAREERDLQELDEHYNSLPTTLSKLEMFFQKSPNMGKADPERDEEEDVECENAGNDCDRESLEREGHSSGGPDSVDTRI